MACFTALEVGLFLQSVLVNGGLESTEENPMLGPGWETLYLCGALHLVQGQPWRLFTCVFLHAGLFHLLPNMLMQWWIGVAVEECWGATWTIVLYVLSGLGGSLLSATLSKPTQLSLGASGALYGLMAAGVAGDSGELGWMPGTQSLLVNTWGAGCVRVWFGWRFIAVLLAFSLIGGLAFPRVDSWAHLGGMVAGFAVAGTRGKRPGGAHYHFVFRVAAAAAGLGGAGACAYFLACGGCLPPPGGAHQVLEILF